MDNVHIICDCTNGSIVNDVREPTLFSFALNKPTGHKVYEEPRIKLLNKINKPVSSLITFNFKDDDQKSVDFKGEKLTFNCQLFKV